ASARTIPPPGCRRAVALFVPILPQGTPPHPPEPSPGGPLGPAQSAPPPSRHRLEDADARLDGWMGAEETRRVQGGRLKRVHDIEMLRGPVAHLETRGIGGDLAERRGQTARIAGELDS